MDKKKLKMNNLGLLYAGVSTQSDIIHQFSRRLMQLGPSTFVMEKSPLEMPQK